jgi:predicted MFS family arabinose efflux permease
MDYRGLALIVSGVALSIFGFQQSAIWGWGNPGIGLCIAAGFLLLVVFVLVELHTESPLMQVRIFEIRPFWVENLVLGIAMLAFVPVFFFASEYAQISLAKTASEAGLFLLYFFGGFVVAAQIGGRMLDRVGAKRPVVIGCVLAAVGFYLWAGRVTTLSFGRQQWFVIVAGAGMGFLIGPASTDAINRASRLSYGEATGITQTVRNYAASLGLAILGTLLVTEMRSHLTTSLEARGLTPAAASSEAARLAQSRSGSSTTAIPHFFRLDFAYATRSVLYGMAIVMAVAAVVAILGLRRGLQEELVSEEETTVVADAAPTERADAGDVSGRLAD